MMTDKYTKEQLHEAYSIEYYAHKNTQEVLKQECRAHALTRRKLLEKQSEITLKEVGDDWRDFIEVKMSKYGSEYNYNDFNTFFNLDHIIIFAFKNNTPIAFGCIAYIANIPYVCYTWNNDTYEGKKAYIKGVRYITKKYPDICFGENGKIIMRKRNEI